MTEIIVEEINETVIDIEDGPSLVTNVDEETVSIVTEFTDPIVVDLNSGPRGEPGAAILTGPYPPNTAVGVMGDMYIVTEGSVLVGQVFRKTSPATWTDVGNVRGPAGGVNTVNGYTGPDVVLTKADVGLDRADNTNDQEKPISTATQTALDTKVTKTGAETIQGNKTFTDSIKIAQPFITPVGDHGYISFLSRDANPLLRTAFLGVATAGSTTFTIQNEMLNGSMHLVTNGTGVINAQAAQLQENGVRVATVNTGVMLSGAQTITGVKTFSNGLATPNVNIQGASGNPFIEIGRVDGGASTPYIDFHTSGTFVDYNVRLMASGSAAGNGGGTLDIVAGQVSVSGAMTVTGTLNTTGGMAASNLTGTINDARLSTNVALKSGSTFTGAVIVPGPTADTHASTKKYVDDQIFILTNGSPALLNTLDELAQAIGDDPNFATTMANSLASKVSLTGDQTISGMKTFTSPIVGAPTGNVLKVGDDTWLADVNVAHTMGVVSATDPTAGGIQFGTAMATTFRMLGSSVSFGISYNTSSLLTLSTAGNLNIAGTFSGGGSGLTALNASSLATGTVANTVLPTRLRERAETITDWNNAISNGWYMGNNILNAPNANWFIGEVVVHDNQTVNRYVTQRVWNFTGTGAADSECYERRSTGNSVWTAWRRVRYLEAELDARYVVQFGNQTISGTKTFTGIGDAGVDGYAAPVVITATNARLGFHSPGVHANQIMLRSDGAFALRNMADNAFIGLRAGAIYDNDARVFSANNHPTAAQLPTSVVHRVVHNGTTWPARPTGATYVEWVGPTAPAAATSNDTWVNTSL